MARAKALLEHQLRHDSQYFYYGVYYTGVGMFKMGGLRRKMHRAALQAPARRPRTPRRLVDAAARREEREGRGRCTARRSSVLGPAIEYRYRARSISGEPPEPWRSS